MRAFAVILAVLVVAASAAVVGGQEEGTVVGRPGLELTVPNNQFSSGERGTVELFVANNGDLDRGGPTRYEERVKTARNVRLRIAEEEFNETLEAGLDVETGEVVAGSVPEGVAGPFPFRVEINESLAPGTYEIPVEVSYDYTNWVRYGSAREPEFGDRSREVTETLTIVIENRPTFAIVPESAGSIPAGDTGTYRFAVTNTGTENATDAQVVLDAGNSSLFFGEAENRRPGTSVFVSSLAPGETRIVDVPVGATRETPRGTYSVRAVVRYQNPNGIDETSSPRELGVTVGTEQTFAVRDVRDDLAVAESGTVRGRIVNTGESRVTDAVVVYRSENPNLSPRETEYAVGDLAPGGGAPFEFTLDVSNGTEPGPRVLDLAVRYRNADGEVRTSPRVDARISVGDEQTFDVRDVSGALRVGEAGAVTGTVVNTGESRVENAVVAFQSSNENVAAREAEYPLGTLAPGEPAPFSVRFEVDNESDPGPRLVSAVVRYRDADGEVRVSDAIDVLVGVDDEQRFAIENATTSLRVGESGDVAGEIVNAGGTNVSSAVVVYRTDTPNLSPRETEYAVGDLAVDESASFSFRIDTSSEAEAGPRLLEFVVRYRNDEGDLRTSDVVDTRVSVGPETDEFRVEPVNATVEAGSSETVVFEVTNTANGTLTDVVAKLFADDPLASDNDEAFVDRLGPGESARLRFNVNVEGAAIPKAYPVSMDFSYEDERGDSVLSDPYRVPVQVTESRRGGNVDSALFVAGAAVLLVVGLLWWRRGSIRRRLS